MSMRYFKVNVNGVAYDVAIEEIGADSANVSAAASAVSAVPSAPAADTAPAANETSSAGGGEGDVKVTAPIRAAVVNVVKNVGDSVKRGDCVCVLEAMKMEYDVVSPCDGTVTSISAKRGSTVDEGAVVFTVRG
ncbi:MAG: acetyl-CoA carboxylase biotin carboxyl carrier protein subunit [Clostridia bacterium]|nr:acetyl-CoA carboxylase biotin carboxyl carrier protein subunit [Clostridia bacterium]